MDVLQPYIDKGVLVVKSGQTKFPDQIAITNWESKGAQDRMDNLLTAYYADENIDVVPLTERQPCTGYRRFAEVSRIRLCIQTLPDPYRTGL